MPDQFDYREALRKIPSETVSFICTDPPHSDRVPYLELSKFQMRS